MQWSRHSSGFTLIEILVVLTVVTILAGLTVVNFSSMRDRADARSEAQTFVAHLEEAKARAVAGTHNESHGIHITEDAYYEFRGDSYDSEGEEVVVHELTDSVRMSSSDGSEPSIVFERMSGMVDNPLSVSIESRTDPEIEFVVSIGAGGDISLE